MKLVHDSDKTERRMSIMDKIADIWCLQGSEAGLVDATAKQYVSNDDNIKAVIATLEKTAAELRQTL